MSGTVILMLDGERGGEAMEVLVMGIFSFRIHISVIGLEQEVVFHGCWNIIRKFINNISAAWGGVSGVALEGNFLQV